MILLALSISYVTGIIGLIQIPKWQSFLCLYLKILNLPNLYRYQHELSGQRPPNVVLGIETIHRGIAGIELVPRPVLIEGEI